MALRLFQRERRSLFGEILDWMLTPLLLLWPISLALTWLVAQNIAGKPFDRALEYNVQALAKLIVVKNKQVQFNLTAPAREILRADDTDLVYYQVMGTRGEFLSGEHDLPPPPDEESAFDGEVRLREDMVQGEEVRVAYTWIKVDVPGARPMLVQVAETLGKRKTLATEIVKGVMVPQFVTLPLAVLLVWLALVRGIKPLDQLEKRIRARKPDDMSPLDETVVPEEVAPLVSSINDLLSRLKVSLTTQKRFLADAAHQLKTPLAGLRMQADLAQRETDADELKKSLKHIGRASIRATHTVNQLLALARAETTGRSLAKHPLDLVQVISEAIQDSVPRALEKHIDLGYEGPPAGERASQLEANPTLLKELVRNLLDNALNYTPEGGHVTVRLLTDRFSGVIVLLVEDSGPGIPESERELVFQPFYRALGTNVDGSGLGLAIVLEIAKQHGATISIDDASVAGHPQSPGTRVTVRFVGMDRPAEAV
ncbi:sensor histidine kinase [Polaromonas sp. SM01]|uniref:sensor histidine kinase n=1 Tax=Polaromonas sp. SM01 TaxID=3085630 RepID=UPI002980FD3E|nr:sensor histidine kinase N-terminal domain-containing protein [Polaromonas sp. SM01]MDW5441097.1 sensor histidine kinase N-terminal domain-containing protein [Polaromonas sp. SM01]